MEYQAVTPMADISHRVEVLLHQEVQACDDPVCSCEAEPRWLRFLHQDDREVTEWDVLDRSLSEEL